MKEFKSLADFSAFTALALPVVLLGEMRRGLTKSAGLIESTAKLEIGEYQPAVGPFPKWAELAEDTKIDRVQHGYPENEPLLRSGELRDSIKREVSDLEAVIGSESEIAAYQEFGTDKIPPRPFMGPALFNNREKIAKILGAAVAIGVSGGQRAAASLGYDHDIS
jgi:HK97 gp10 family phage protein